MKVIPAAILKGKKEREWRLLKGERMVLCMCNNRGGNRRRRASDAGIAKYKCNYTKFAKNLKTNDIKESN